MESLTISSLENVYQIYYDSDTKGKCFSGFKSFDNTGKLTEFFENSAIYQLCEQGKHREGRYFGVLSPVFFFKAHRLRSPAVLESHFSDEPDALGVNLKSRNPNMITQGDRWHPGFSDLFEKIIRKAGIDFDFRRVKDPTKNVFSNYVIAKPEIWERYFYLVLKPCMDVMADPANEEIYELLWRDAGYHKSKKSQAHRRYLQASYGKPYYTYHTFICERFWTLFLWMNPDINFKNV